MIQLLLFFCQKEEDIVKLRINTRWFGWGEVASSCQVLLRLLVMSVFEPTCVIRRFRPADGLVGEEAACG